MVEGLDLVAKIGALSRFRASEVAESSSEVRVSETTGIRS